jgi:hypothetical protein
MMSHQTQTAPIPKLSAADAFLLMMNQQHLMTNQHQIKHYINQNESALNDQYQVMSSSTKQPSISNMSQTPHTPEPESKNNSKTEVTVQREFMINETSPSFISVTKKHKQSHDLNCSSYDIKNSRNAGKKHNGLQDVRIDTSGSPCSSSQMMNTTKHYRQNSMKTSSMYHSQVNQLPLHSFQIPLSSRQPPQGTNLHQSSINMSDNRQGIFPQSISPLVLSQMQTWSLNQLGEFYCSLLCFQMLLITAADHF